MKYVNKDNMEFEIGANIIATITPEILCLEKDPRKETPIHTMHLKYPVVTGAWVKYNNNLGLKFQRYHNVYLNQELNKYFIDIFDILFFLEDDFDYKIKTTMGKHGYTIDNVLQ